ncbi:MAG: NADH-quinone oxidoreductase subunit L [Polyangiaceae bacterium]|nr:NADH-quinone oxidoreductase subunit L [Polyangiaceae bacterium]
MTDLSSAWPPLAALAALAVPLTYGLAAASVSAARPFALARTAAGAALGFALVAAAGVTLAPPAQPRASAGVLALVPRPDGLTSTMLVLVCFLGVVLLCFSRGYLDGDPGRARYVRGLTATLAAVTTLVTSDHLLVIALAWMGTSLALHPLLTFYSDRPRARLAAHKKFLVSRAADLCVCTAIALVGLQAGSFALDDVAAWAAAPGPLPPAAEVAAALFAVGASLKCAQLPFHGWLIQVMEAPTPVSALLHAGVVNLGGFLLLRLAPLMSKAAPAQTLLVVVGGATAVLAALVMATRVSIKVALAWSTCAQMGFLLVQCGLGAYRLALVHLVAHSLYKAHAFLSSGSAVDRWRALALAPLGAPPSFGRQAATAAVAVAGAVALAATSGSSPRDRPETWALALVLGLALALPAARAARGGPARLTAVALGLAATAALSSAWHVLAAHAVPETAQGEPPTLRAAFVVVSFATLFAAQAALQSRPDGRLARALYPQLFAGFYLDEFFTRLTFRLWPPRLPPAATPRPMSRAPEALEVRA